LPDMRFVPALSHQDWDGETGLITDVVDRSESDLADVDAYLCGPPPMVDAAIELLVRRGVPEAQIYYDKFTTSAEAEETRT
jgi:propane monooxygenase reductase subunit